MMLVIQSDMFSLATIFIIFLLFLWIFYNLRVTIHRIIRLRKLPHPKPKNILAGNLLEFWKKRHDPLAHFVELAEEFRPKAGFYIIWVTIYPIAYIVSPDLATKILKNKRSLNRGWPADRLCADFEGLMCLSNQEWQDRRNLVTPSLAPSVFEQFAPTIIKHTNRMIDELGTKNGKAVELAPIFIKYRMYIIVENVFGLDAKLDEAQGMEILRDGIGFLDNSLARSSCPYRWLDSTDWLYRKIHGIRDYQRDLRMNLQAMVVKKIKDHRERRENEKTVHYRAFLDYMIDVYLREDEGCKKLNLKAIVDETSNIVAGSYETLNLAFLWLFHRLACNPEIQEKVYEELVDFDEKNPNLTILQINGLKYLDLCVKETLRMHPSVPKLIRVLGEDIGLGDHILPQGTQTSIGVYEIHHDERVYPDPYKFDPSRFEPEKFSKIPAHSYIPFGDGPRRCIGERAGLFELKMIAINLLKRFQVFPVDQENIHINLDEWGLRPGKPLIFRFVPRD
ncbi:cytochrome P450 4c3-like [Brevipalpus obovatus]|uniref:cytochrome P450 4c3-like n=1 Tax=Brevipalpus obovatus TaxID=246614 RepID=UPI003D9E27C5